MLEFWKHAENCWRAFQDWTCDEARTAMGVSEGASDGILRRLSLHFASGRY